LNQLCEQTASTPNGAEVKNTMAANTRKQSIEEGFASTKPYDLANNMLIVAIEKQ